MPDPADLLSVARLLAVVRAPSQSDAQLRRAVSTAYYAVFHKLLRTAARRFMGEDQEESAGYALLYRSFDHQHMKVVCESLNVSMLKAKLQRQLGRKTVSTDMRVLASNFAMLQERRHLADYDPCAAFLPSAVASIVYAAEEAIKAFDRVAPDEQTDVLALMMVKTKG